MNTALFLKIQHSNFDIHFSAYRHDNASKKTLNMTLDCKYYTFIESAIQHFAELIIIRYLIMTIPLAH